MPGTGTWYDVGDPGKDRKLAEVASRPRLIKRTFERLSRQLIRIWPLFPCTSDYVGVVYGPIMYLLLQLFDILCMFLPFVCFFFAS